MVAVNQTITIINKSGKIVSSTKLLGNVFSEAKSAYNERKAELKAARREAQKIQDDERAARQKLETLQIEEVDGSYRSASRRGSDDGRRSERSSTSRRERSDDGRRSERSSTSRRERPPVERGVSDSFYANDRPLVRQSTAPLSRTSQLRQEVAADEVRNVGLVRRHTDGLDVERRSHRSTTQARRDSVDDIDMDLAYGELPPPLPERKYDDELMLRQKMGGLQKLLDECNCIQHSATAVVDHLQQNPDALAAVALALGEISNLLAKMAPGAIGTLKGAFPTIIALLASPEFAIAAGVGVGVTIIALGGYKIVKKIRAQRDRFLEDGTAMPATTAIPAGKALPENEPATPPNEEEQLRELSSIEVWRRGIADVEAENLGTIVDGELITEHASKTLIQEGRLTEADFKPKSEVSGKTKERVRRKRRSSKSTHESRTSRSERTSRSQGKTKTGVKTEPSGIRMLFKRTV